MLARLPDGRRRSPIAVVRGVGRAAGVGCRVAVVRGVGRFVAVVLGVAAVVALPIPGVSPPGPVGVAASAVGLVADARTRSSPTAEAVAARWRWPTGVAIVLRPWEAPDSEYGPGHRGIDVPAAVGTEARAVADGTVAFAGSVGGRPVLTVDHGGGLVSTLDSVNPSVRAGDVVEQGEVVGTVTEGHCSARAPCLHLGARLDGRYVDPTPFLSAPEWPVLLPSP